jgi:hypothetical protein
MIFSLKLRLVWLASGSQASSSWLVIANELKSWLLSQASHEPSELTSFEFFVQPYAVRAGPDPNAVPGLPRTALPGNRVAVPKRTATVDQRFCGVVLPEVQRVACLRGPGDATACCTAGTIAGGRAHAINSRVRRR